MKRISYFLPALVVLLSCGKPAVCQFEVVNQTGSPLCATFASIDSDTLLSKLINTGESGVFWTTDNEYIGIRKKDPEVVADSAGNFRTIRIFADSVKFDKSPFFRKKTQTETFNRETGIYNLVSLRMFRKEAVLNFTVVNVNE